MTLRLGCQLEARLFRQTVWSNRLSRSLCGAPRSPRIGVGSALDDQAGLAVTPLSRCSDQHLYDAHLLLDQVLERHDDSSASEVGDGCRRAKVLVEADKGVRFPEGRRRCPANQAQTFLPRARVEPPILQVSSRREAPRGSARRRSPGGPRFPGSISPGRPPRLASAAHDAAAVGNATKGSAMRQLTDSERYERECAHKRAYASKADAKQAEKRSKCKGGDRLRPYRCTWCEAFHLGHGATPVWEKVAAYV
jgi:hypothetical protein